MRRVVELTGITVRLLTDSNRPANTCNIMVITHYQDYPKYTYMCLPCTRSSAGSLSLLEAGEILTAVHVMLVLSKEVNAVSFNLDKYMPCVIGINVIFCS